MNRKRSARAALSAAVASLILISGCSAVPEDSMESPGTSTPASNGSVLNAYLYQSPKILSPLAPFNGPDRQLMSLIFDGLVNVDDQNEYIGRLAESWDISEDGRTYTFHLREGLMWSDGEPFTSEDVLFTYTVMTNPEITAQAGRFAGVAGAADYASGAAETVSGYSAPDDNTFVIEFAEPDVAFLSKIVGNAVPFIMPEHILGEVAEAELMENEFFLNPDVGMGPFQLVEFLPDQHVELEANPNFRSEVGIERIYFRTATSDVATAQLETGEFDLASVSTTDVARFDTVDSVNIESVPGTGPTVVGIATDQPYLSDPRVRQAMMYAIDRVAITEAVLDGYGSVPDLHWLTSWGVADDLNDYAHNPERAQELLAEAGWDPEQEVSLMWVPGTRDRDQAAVIVQESLRQVGMNVVANQVQPAENAERLDAREWDLAIWGGGLYTVDPSSAVPVLRCDSFRPKGSNTPHYCNPEFDELAMAAQATTDQDERAALYEDASRILNHDVPFIWMYVPDTIFGVNERLEGFKPHGALENAFWNAHEWTLSD